ncbi:MAG: ABC transporter ATP-binding protein [Acidobacteria bacterium]|nr:ABC transporter ATP-binding protein [Acidobacteriota bacterium]
MTAPLLVASGVVKGYRTAAGYVPVLQGLDLEVAAGEMLAITGASGVGKSTLLHVLGTLDRPEAGTVRVGAEDVFKLAEVQLREFRNRTLGFVFQFHHLLPEFTALENVMMPALIARRPEAEARERARALLDELGLGHRGHHRPGALSGGEQQRVAVARALVQSPRALLADEPTGNLDKDTGERLHDVLRRMNREKGITVVVVTHNERLAGACDRALRLEGGGLRPDGGGGGGSSLDPALKRA